MQFRRFSPAVLFGVLCSIYTSGTVQAAPIYVDTFSYPAGALAGQGPPAGSPAGQGAWSNYSGSAQVTRGGLADAGVQTTGSKATISGLGAPLGDDVIAATSQVGGAGGGVVWVGFLINQASGGSNPGGFDVVSVGSSSAGSGIGIGMLDNENIYGIDNNINSPVQRARTFVSADGTVVFLVAKLDFSAGMEYIFVNPSLTSEPADSAASASQAMTSVFQAAGINQVLLAAGGNTVSFNIGELRIGTAFADVVPAPVAFFTGETSLGNGVYYLAFTSGNDFGYFSFLSDPNYLYHFDLGYEYVFDAADGRAGVYFYDFTSSGFFYTSPSFPFPYLYDFSLNSTVYYYPDPNNPGRYNTNGTRYFYVFSTGQIISK